MAPEASAPNPPFDESSPEPVRLELALHPVDAGDVFLYHKTTHRKVYDAARAGRTAGDDVLLYNERGEITETCRANVALRMGGELCTPPVACGLLAGTLRRTACWPKASCQSAFSHCLCWNPATTCSR